MKIEAEMRARERDNLQHLLRMVCRDICNPISIIKTVFFLVSLEAERLKNMALITIRDTGIGMPRDLMRLLFDPQAKTSRRGTNNEEGTGFGMPLVKTFLAMFGGNIHIESVEQQPGTMQDGTRVEIRLPIAESD